MKDAANFRQAVCESRKSDKIVKFLTADQFTDAIQQLLDNGDAWGAYFERSGALVVEDRDGRRHYNGLADGTARRAQARWVVVNPLTAAEGMVAWKSRKSASEAIEDGRLSSDWVIMTEKQWARFLGQAQQGDSEAAQRALVTAIVGYDY